MLVVVFVYLVDLVSGCFVVVLDLVASLVDVDVDVAAVAQSTAWHVAHQSHIRI